MWLPEVGFVSSRYNNKNKGYGIMGIQEFKQTR